MSRPVLRHRRGTMATKSGKSDADQYRAGDIDLTELNARASRAGYDATTAEAVNPPGTDPGMKSVTTSDT